MLYETIVAQGLDPAEFSLKDTFFRVVITHNSGSTFEFSPAVGRVQFQVKVHVEGGIDEVVRERNLEGMAAYSFRHWLTEITATAGAPDYWEEIERSQESVEVIGRAGCENAVFTEGERRQITAQFLDIQIKLNQFKLPGEQMSRVEEKLAELDEASLRLGRKDWLILLMTTISPLVVDDIVTPGLARHIFALVIDGLNHLFANADESGGGSPGGGLRG